MGFGPAPVQQDERSRDGLGQATFESATLGFEFLVQQWFLCCCPSLGAQPEQIMRLTC